MDRASRNQHSLFPQDHFRRDVESRLLVSLEQSLKRVRSGGVSPALDMERFRAELSAKTFTEQEGLPELLDWTIGWLERGLVHTTHPRYFGLFNPAPSFAAICADHVAAAFNPQVCVWSHAPAAVEIEAHVIDHVARRAGLPEGAGGHFTSGGSEANNTAALCAFTASNPDFGERGMRALRGAPRIYVSRDSHLAWLKIVRQLGAGRAAIRLIATDGRGRMDPSALDKAIHCDSRAGDVPIMIAATAGTTNAGVVDPLHACADLAQRHAMWFHVDAAWGGAVLASDKYRHVLQGIERADSVTIDAHKWFATTMGAGMYLTRQRELLSKAFQVVADYMPSNDSATDLYVTSAQWSRRFVGLRLFLALGAVGWRGYAAHVERAIDMIERFSTALTRNGWTRVNESKMAVACFVPPASSVCVDDVVSRVLAAGDAWLSAANFEGRRVIRVCATNGTTTAEDFDSLCERLLECSATA